MQRQTDPRNMAQGPAYFLTWSACCLAHLEMNMDHYSFLMQSCDKGNQTIVGSKKGKATEEGKKEPTRRRLSLSAQAALVTCHSNDDKIGRKSETLIESGNRTESGPNVNPPTSELL